LLPASEDELQRAVALADVATAAKKSTAEWVYRYFLFAKGLADYRQGRLDSAIALMKGDASGVMGPSPRLILAMALHDQGKHELARKTLGSAIVAFDWSTAEADRRDVWIVHVLRRQAEAAILPDLPSFWSGDYQPRDNDERFALVGACQFHGRYYTAARLYAEALESEPALAENLAAECRARAVSGDNQPPGRQDELSMECLYPAARCAALAASGIGADAGNLDEAERARWRKQARDWLRADLRLWSRTLDGGSRAARTHVRKLLWHWQVNPDLAGVREAHLLEGLPIDERNECLELWKEVAAVFVRSQNAK
jgi:serine/threonine-protein kinase